MNTPHTPLTDQTWTTFCETPQTLGPVDGVRQQWHRDRPRYTVWLLRVRNIHAIKRWRTVTNALDHSLIPQPENDLHITVWVAGFPTHNPTLDDDIAEHTLAEQGAHLRTFPGPLHLTIGGANAFLSCAFLEVHDPHLHLAKCRKHLASVGVPEIRFAPYIPHVTLGRFGHTTPTGPIAETLRPFRNLPPLPIVAEAIERIDYETHLDTPPLHTQRRISLETR